MHIDSFSGAAVSLPPAKRTPDDVLDALRRSPRVSCFDMSEHAWLRNAIQRLEQQGRIIETGEPYPWLRFKILEGGEG